MSVYEFPSEFKESTQEVFRRASERCQWPGLEERVLEVSPEKRECALHAFASILVENSAGKIIEKAPGLIDRCRKLSQNEKTAQEAKRRLGREVRDAGWLWISLIKKGYINGKGVIQDKFKYLNNFSEMDLENKYAQKKAFIYETLIQSQSPVESFDSCLASMINQIAAKISEPCSEFYSRESVICEKLVSKGTDKNFMKIYRESMAPYERFLRDVLGWLINTEWKQLGVETRYDSYRHPIVENFHYAKNFLVAMGTFLAIIALFVVLTKRILGSVKR